MKVRSSLFVPSNSEKLIRKGLASHADIVIFDLEDSVALSEKTEVRELLYKTLMTEELQKTFFVRVNDVNTSFFEEDVKRFAPLKNIHFVLPKTEAKKDIKQLELIAGTKKSIIPIIESAIGLHQVDEIATSSDSIIALAFGAVDFTNDIGATLTKSGEEILFARSKLVLASRVAKLSPPIDTVYVDFNNQEGFINESTTVRKLGFQGKLLIHPSQIDLANHVFSPSEKEIAYAKRIIDAFEQAEEKGIAAISLDGNMIDYPVVAKARRILEVGE